MYQRERTDKSSHASRRRRQKGKGEITLLHARIIPRTLSLAGATVRVEMLETAHACPSVSSDREPLAPGAPSGGQRGFVSGGGSVRFRLL